MKNYKIYNGTEWVTPCYKPFHVAKPNIGSVPITTNFQKVNPFYDKVNFYNGNDWERMYCCDCGLATYNEGEINGTHSFTFVGTVDVNSIVNIALKPYCVKSGLKQFGIKFECVKAEPGKTTGRVAYEFYNLDFTKKLASTGIFGYNSIESPVLPGAGLYSVSTIGTFTKQEDLPPNKYPVVPPTFVKHDLNVITNPGNASLYDLNTGKILDDNMNNLHVAKNQNQRVKTLRYVRDNADAHEIIWLAQIWVAPVGVDMGQWTKYQRDSYVPSDFICSQDAFVPEPDDR